MATKLDEFYTRLADVRSDAAYLQRRLSSPPIRMSQVEYLTDASSLRSLREEEARLREWIRRVHEAESNYMCRGVVVDRACDGCGKVPGTQKAADTWVRVMDNNVRYVLARYCPDCERYMGLDVPEPSYLSLGIAATCKLCGDETTKAESDGWYVSSDHKNFICPTCAPKIARLITVAEVEASVGQHVEIRTADLSTVYDGVLENFVGDGYAIIGKHGVAVFTMDSIIDTAKGPGGILIIRIHGLLGL